jgi:Zn-dependent protease
VASLLVHELAHLLVAQHRGVRAKSVTLWLLGGTTELEGEARTPRAELEIAVVGPLASLVLSGAAFALIVGFDGPPIVWTALLWLALMNLMLGVFNLLPGAPLDGGRVLHSLLWRRYHDRARADQVAARAGQALGGTLVALGFAQLIFWSMTGGIWTVMVGWFLANAAQAELAGRTARDALTGLRVRDVMTPDPDLAPAWFDIDRFVESVAMRSHQTVFPVADFSGTPVGYVPLETLHAVPAAERGSTRIDHVDRPLGEGQIVAPDDDAVTLVSHPFTGELVAVVVDGERVVGMITAADLSRVMRLASLRTPH